ncbi:hypothetical protein K470DRAFT_208677 [Piedraia hortae CBS 480.64]|uniref:Uncharacterized protein n=1 Tax=Piedraia hortae CBS 480.64 TaxID=1314780 RepID=A0A6A7C9S5_9PEZI|nr:hypothetical protein K470DRAFT_208677 [Piedraia hortae CBS 480.64]
MRERKRKRGRGRDSIDKVDDGGEEVVGDASPGSSRSLPPSLALAYKNNWSWIATAPPPTRSESTAQFHFESHPEFTPNKSPKEILRQGSFGGSFFRPLTPRSLGGKVTISDDWMELPTSWTVGLDVERYLTSSVYDPSVNRYGVACGQSIEEWEAAGWINAEFDVRGWFQWYCRFFMGRRCEDDERQVGRWARCVGPRGRWRKALFKKYVEKGVRVITDEEGDGEDVSPVIHQTCLHWAFEPRQEDLDELWG